MNKEERNVLIQRILELKQDPNLSERERQRLIDEIVALDPKSSLTKEQERKLHELDEVIYK